ncbi:MAG: hypothetical protein J7J99_07330 [Thermoprotei archaeon]|nr:hypothetical protein [Thermoprotei archaeon]
MIPKDLPIRSSLKRLSLIILVMMVPWFIAYVTSTPFVCITLMALFWLTPIGTILMAFSLALIVGIIYGCLSTALSDPYSHLKAFAYAHGLFTSTTSLPLLYTLIFTEQVDPIRFPEFFRFTIPLWIALPVYFSLYTVYALLAYRSLSEIIGYHSRKPLKDVVRYWRLGAVFCLLTAIVIIIVIIRNLLNPEKTFVNRAIPPIYVVIILTIMAIILFILGLDELFFGGRFRRIRYPIITPLIAHMAWVLTLVRGHGGVLSPSGVWPFIVFSSAMFPLPGLITIAGIDHVLTFSVASAYFYYGFKVEIEYPPSIIWFSLGFWLFFEFIAFYKMLTFTSVRASIREVLDFVLDILRIRLITVRIKARAFRDGMLVIYVVNESYEDITDFKAYLIGVDWASLDKPLILDLKLEGKEEVVKIPSGDSVILICEDWSFSKHVYADKVLSVKITYNVGEKAIEKVYTIPIT